MLKQRVASVIFYYGTFSPSFLILVNLVTDSSFLLRWTLRRAEWSLLLMLTLLYALEQYFYKIQIIPNLFLKVITFNIIFFILSFIFPLERPLWQRRAYIAVEILLFIIAVILGIEFSVLFYFFLVKSCFLLNRREVLLTVALAGAGYMIGVAWSIPLTQTALAEIRSHNWEELYKPPAIFLGAFVEYMGISIFVILLGFVIVAERRSRQRAEALTQEVETLAAALERSRIAREIHDSLGHSLTTLNVQLELALEMRQREPERASQAFSNAQLLASQCLEDVRRAVQTVRQQDFNLKEALNALIERVKQNRSLTIHSQVNLPLLPLQTSHQLYCIVQEGFTNIQKHARASCVRLQSQVTPNSITLELEDDGQGFDPMLPHEGYGLRGMYERVQMLGGKLLIKSTVGQGTQIQVTVPL